MYVLLHFFEGKLIDVIRDKRASEDGDFYWMLAGFESELGDMEIQTSSENSFLVCSQGLKFLKSEQEALHTMIDGFFDSYVISASFE